ncbi:hypothetical protein [Paenibacillus prosopidis]|uniref:Uncharacterized protein n=1 Tax=Paenibacillus prosopidis TaxID=630520 RepID=A0A368VZT2_9BACL|nr:hypothetical protein [Paenibacillus prosopidis]RCW47929.1 hypothetical protein DFP97_107131 [Paenibacillus prosopidis]
MNIFERHRIKNSLRGCDYVLAADVIKEKFLDKSNESYGYLHKYIEVFLANPCLDHALKLIEQDSMMFFYFNGCKEDGLYKKQTNKIKMVTANESKKPVSDNILTMTNPKKTNFPNVISTLIYDCSEIENQIKEFQRLLNEGKDIEHNQRLLEHYKEGLREFEKAIKVLQKYDGLELGGKSVSSQT